MYTQHPPYLLLVHHPISAVQLLGIGVDELVKQGMLNKCKEGPLYWLDTADSQPCIGTGGIAAWQLTAHGETAGTSISAGVVCSWTLKQALTVSLGRAWLLAAPTWCAPA